MKPTEFKVEVPEGYAIDKENSTYECIKFVKLPTSPTVEEILAPFEKYVYYSHHKPVIDRGCKQIIIKGPCANTTWLMKNFEFALAFYKAYPACTMYILGDDIKINYADMDWR